jgi:MFS family permease
MLPPQTPYEGNKQPTSDAIHPKQPSAFLIFLLALTTGSTAANIYYSHSLIHAIKESFHAADSHSAAVTTFSQLGFAAGLLFLVPLGDSFNRKVLIVTTAFLSSITLAALASAPNLSTLFICYLALGFFSITSQLVPPTPPCWPDHKNEDASLAS